MGHINRRNKFVVNALEGAMWGKRPRKASTIILKGSRQEHRS